MFRSDDVSAIADAECTDAGRELAFRRSLRGSRARRAAAALRRQRVLRSRGSALVAAAGLLMLSAGAVAATGGTGGASAGPGLSETTIAAVQRALGIEADGILGPSTRRATRRFQDAHGLKVDGLLGPRTLEALGVDPDDQQDVGAALDPRLEAIAECESGGDPNAVSAGGRYYGKYQFSLETWRSVDGRGNPVDAPEAEQDQRAATLLARDGATAWPNCA